MFSGPGSPAAAGRADRGKGGAAAAIAMDAEEVGMAAIKTATDSNLPWAASTPLLTITSGPDSEVYHFYAAPPAAFWNSVRPVDRARAGGCRPIGQQPCAVAPVGFGCVRLRAL